MSRHGQRVSVFYKGYLEDGTMFDRCDEGKPFSFVVGTSSVMPGFEKAVCALRVGETAKVSIPPEDAYGPYQPDAVQKFPLYLFGEDSDFPVGKMISLTSPKTNRPAIVKVLKVEDGIVYLDFNHTLAGRELSYEITLVSAEGDELC